MPKYMSVLSKKIRKKFLFTEMENEVFVDGKTFMKAAEMFPEECFQRKYFYVTYNISQFLLSCLIYQDDSNRVNGTLHFFEYSYSTPQIYTDVHI